MAKSTNSKKNIPKKFTQQKPDTNSDFQPLESKIAATSSDVQETGLQKLFADSIKDIYWAENHLVKSLPKMIKSAPSGELQNAFTDHLAVTKQHVSRLEKVFELLGLSKEGEGVIESTDSGTAAREQGLIMAAQKVEHYEIATYGSLAKLAATLGHSEIADILQQTLGEEKEADELLTGIAENSKLPDSRESDKKM